jgi:hypothetical protein
VSDQSSWHRDIGERSSPGRSCYRSAGEVESRGPGRPSYGVGGGWAVNKVEEQVLDDSMQHKANLCDVSDCR